MRTEKRWLKQILKEAVDNNFDMPWQQNTRPAAFIGLHQDTCTKAA
ncbi:MAG: hypothetical protein JKX71_00750 [Amylibacter sp.]|nr:hypothetical protein [Amylibacter sp.]